MAFTFKILILLREALPKHFDPRVRTIEDLEAVLHIRLVVAPPARDVDEVGMLDWQPVIYSSNLDHALAFIDFILQYKIQNGYLASMPQLAVHFPNHPVGWAPAVPTPWGILGITNQFIPKPFSVLPPKGRRHVLLQLEKKECGEGAGSREEGNEEEEEDRNESPTYVLTFYGGIYPFKERFEARGIPGALIESMDSERLWRTYVRYLEVQMEAEGLKQVRVVLQDVLKQMPVYFINMAGEADAMAARLCEEPSVFQAEVLG